MTAKTKSLSNERETSRLVDDVLVMAGNEILRRFEELPRYEALEIVAKLAIEVGSKRERPCHVCEGKTNPNELVCWDCIMEGQKKAKQEGIKIGEQNMIKKVDNLLYLCTGLRIDEMFKENWQALKRGDDKREIQKPKRRVWSCHLQADTNSGL